MLSQKFLGLILLAAARKESGAWLSAVPVISLGLRMEDKVLKFAVGQRIGAPLVQPHVCCHYGEQVDVKGIYGKSCRRSQGRFIQGMPL